MKVKKMNLNNIEIGQEIPPFKVKIEKKVYGKYNRLIHEINPLHFNLNYAKKLGFDNIVVAGNFLFSYISKWIINWIDDINVISKISIKFGEPVYLDEEIVHKGKVVEIQNLENKKIVMCEYLVEKLNRETVMNGIIKLDFLKK